MTNEDLIMILIAFLLGYVDDINKPKEYYYGDTHNVILVDKKYQCPTYCAVDHNHYVYFSSDSNGMTIDQERLGPRYKPPKKDKQRTLQ